MGHHNINVEKLHYNQYTFTGLELLKLTIFDQKVYFKIFRVKIIKAPARFENHI